MPLAWTFSRRTKRLVFYRGWVWRDFEWIKASRLRLAAFRWAQRLADRILVLAPAFKAALIEIGVPADKIVVVSTMFEGAPLATALNDCRAKRPQILFLSRFLPAKGGASLITAFNLISARFPAWSLVMAGDGPEAQHLKALVKENDLEDKVRFTGYIGGGEKAKLLAESSLFVLPTSHSEGMPNAILEAMAAGQPIITTSVGGIDQVVTDNVNGLILTSTMPGAIAVALEKYLSDDELLTRTGAINRDLAWRSWESNIVAGKIADIYQGLIRGD